MRQPFLFSNHPRSLLCGKAHVRDICAQCGKKYFIPYMCAGVAESAFPGVFKAASKAIEKLNQE